MMDKTVLNSYDLYEPFHNIWVIASRSGQAFYGTLSEVLNYMVNKLHFSLDEIEFGLLEMTKNSHNAAHFGIIKTFIYTYNKEINHERAS